MITSTQYQLSLLPSDWFLWLVVLLVLLGIWHIRRQPHLREAWQGVFKRPVGMITAVILACFVLVALMDSVHVKLIQHNSRGQMSSQSMKSVLDLWVAPLGEQQETTYSAPFSTHSYAPMTRVNDQGNTVRYFPSLLYAGRMLVTLHRSERQDIIYRLLTGIGWWCLGCLALIAIISIGLLVKYKNQFYQQLHLFWQGKTTLAWRSSAVVVALVLLLFVCIGQLDTAYHIFGTTKVGIDVFYETIKSIRTGIMIGTLTILFMLPFALILGLLAGYCGGLIDDVIQYIYTTLSSIPGVLLISASVLMMQVYIANHEAMFPTLLARADIRLLSLCVILGVTSWAGLCRLVRAETLKLRDQEYVLAARTLGVRFYKILLRHLMPNVMHLVMITIVLDFSGLVLAEAVLSYVGVGVDPTMMSWGNMINSARLELARSPMVWWPLLAAMLLMFLLVLSANLFADCVRDAFDPRIRQR